VDNITGFPMEGDFMPFLGIRCHKGGKAGFERMSEAVFRGAKAVDKFVR
jgi:hypothetical protein